MRMETSTKRSALAAHSNARFVSADDFAMRTRSWLGQESGATAIEYALMVGLLAIGIITATVSLKDNIGTVFKTMGGQVYTGQHSGAPVNFVFVSGSGTTVTGSFQDSANHQSRDSTISGTKTPTDLDVVRTHRASIANGCQQRWTGTSTDGGKSYSGTWAEVIVGTCGGSGPFTIREVG
jgi:pilus assembly protein Flp/PilA